MQPTARKTIPATMDMCQKPAAIPANVRANAFRLRLSFLFLEPHPIHREVPALCHPSILGHEERNRRTLTAIGVAVASSHRVLTPIRSWPGGRAFCLA